MIELISKIKEIPVKESLRNLRSLRENTFKKESEY